MDWNKEIVFASSDPNLSRKLTKLVSEGKLRKLARRIYTLENPVRVAPLCQSKLTPCTKICLTLFAKIKMSPVGI